MTKRALTLQGAGEPVPSISWSDSSLRPKALLLAIHGGVQHAGSYTALAERLAPLGIIVYSIDLRGHGEWLHETGHRPALNYRSSTDDVIALAKQLKANHPGLPLFCMGESLGAAVTLRATADTPNLFDGIILSSPGTKPVVWQDWHSLGHSVYQGVKTLGTSIDLSPFMRRMSEDPRSCTEMIEDQDNRTTASVVDLIRMGGFVHKNRVVAKHIPDNMPILFLQGSADRICDAGSAQQVFDDLSSKDKTLKVFPGCGHLIITTKYLKPEVLSTLENWLTAQVGSPLMASHPQSISGTTHMPPLQNTVPGQEHKPFGT